MIKSWETLPSKMRVPGRGQHVVDPGVCDGVGVSSLGVGRRGVWKVGLLPVLQNGEVPLGRT